LAAAARWLDRYTTVALPTSGTTGTSATQCPRAGQAAVDWGETQLGAPNAPAGRYR